METDASKTFRKHVYARRTLETRHLETRGKQVLSSKLEDPSQKQVASL